MAKKKNKKKHISAEDFTKILNDNQKKIMIADGEEKVSLAEATEKTIEKITCVPMEGMIPVSSEEAVKKTTNETGFSIHYAKSPFIIYEYAMKYRSIPQTLVMTMTESDIEDLFDFDINPTITVLMERTNIGLIIKGMKKSKNKIKNWLKEETENDLDMFVLNIPDIVLFTNQITKKEVSRTKRFTLCIQVIKTRKKLSKLKKKEEEKFKEISEKIVDNTLQIAVNLGNSYIHIELNEDFMLDCKDYIKYITTKYDNDKELQKLVNKIIYTTTNTNFMTEAANVLFELV